MRRKTSLPAACPAVRGKPFLVAQRPLPSMMMAMCSGGGRAGASRFFFWNNGIILFLICV